MRDGERARRARSSTRFGNGVTLRNRTRYADYDKFYQNVFPGAVNAAGTTVAHLRPTTTPRSARTCSTRPTSSSRRDRRRRAHAARRAPSSAGRRPTTSATPATSPRSARRRPATPVLGATRRSRVPVDVPPERHRRRQPRRRHRRRASTSQDQIALSPQCRLIAGVRYRPLRRRLHQQPHRPGLRAHDDLSSRRASALVYKPVEPRLALRQLQRHLPAARRRAALLADR